MSAIKTLSGVELSPGITGDPKGIVSKQKCLLLIRAPGGIGWNELVALDKKNTERLIHELIRTLTKFGKRYQSPDKPYHKH